MNAAEKVSLPGWTLSTRGFERACRHLGTVPAPALMQRVNRYLAAEGARREPSPPFTGWLAEREPGRAGLAALDVWTRLAAPAHPWRFRFNAILSVEETTARDVYATPAGVTRLAAWLDILGVGLSFAASLALGLPWFSLMGLWWIAAGRPGRGARRFHGKRCVVVGASRGLGREIACRLASHGARVLCIARPGEGLERMNSETAGLGLSPRLSWLAADISEPQGLLSAAAAAGWPLASVDYVIVTAGVKPAGALLDGEGATREVFSVNAFAPIELARSCLTAWKGQPDRGVILVSSLGRWHGMPETGLYNASKAALSILAQSLAMDLAASGWSGARLTLVEPGLIRTSMVRPGLATRLLSCSVEHAAERVLEAASTGRAVSAFPLAFAILTAALTILPLRLRASVLIALRPTGRGR